MRSHYTDALITHEAASPFTIVDGSFSHCVNFLLALSLWRELKNQKPPLHYIAIAENPLSKNILSKTLAALPELREERDLLLNSYPSLIEGSHTLKLLGGQVTLQLIIDVPNTLSDFSFTADKWLLEDGLISALDDDINSGWLLQLLKTRSRHNACISCISKSFTESTKENLENLGFTVSHEKQAKFALLTGKRTLENGQQADYYSSALPSWVSPCGCPVRPKQGIDVQDVIIIGAGLAGLTTAWTLAEQGLSTTIIDSRAAPVMGASGQTCLIMYSKLPTIMNQEARLALACTQFSQQFFSRLSENVAQEDILWDQRGVLQLDWNLQELEKNNRRSENLSLPTDFMEKVGIEKACLISGTQLKKGGLWFPKNGIVYPGALAKRCTSHSKIDSIFNCKANRFGFDGETETWSVTTSSHGLLRSRYLVVACAYEAQTFPQTNQFPVRLIRGQTSTIKHEGLSTPTCVLCGEGYLAATYKGTHIGATYDLNNSSDKPETKDHLENIHKLARWLPEWDNSELLNTADYTTKAGLRCTTRDYNPIVGAVPKFRSMQEKFSRLRQDATACKGVKGEYYKNLFINIGHGSKGVVTTPMAAEIITSEVVNAPLPINAELSKMLHPARFLIKNLVQNKI